MHLILKIYTVMHPTDWKEGAAGPEFVKPVSIGNRGVIGAGSIVTKDIPENVFAAGNPCRVIKHLAEI